MAMMLDTVPGGSTRPTTAQKAAELYDQIQARLRTVKEQRPDRASEYDEVWQAIKDAGPEGLVDQWIRTGTVAAPTKSGRTVVLHREPGGGSEQTRRQTIYGGESMPGGPKHGVWSGIKLGISQLGLGPRLPIGRKFLELTDKLPGAVEVDYRRRPMSGREVGGAVAGELLPMLAGGGALIKGGLRLAGAPARLGKLAGLVERNPLRAKVALGGGPLGLWQAGETWRKGAERQEELPWGEPERAKLALESALVGGSMVPVAGFGPVAALAANLPATLGATALGGSREQRGISDLEWGLATSMGSALPMLGGLADRLGTHYTLTTGGKNSWGGKRVPIFGRAAKAQRQGTPTTTTETTTTDLSVARPAPLEATEDVDASWIQKLPVDDSTKLALIEMNNARLANKGAFSEQELLEGTTFFSEPTPMRPEPAQLEANAAKSQDVQPTDTYQILGMFNDRTPVGRASRGKGNFLVQNTRTQDVFLMDKSDTLRSTRMMVGEGGLKMPLLPGFDAADAWGKGKAIPAYPDLLLYGHNPTTREVQVINTKTGKYVVTTLDKLGLKPDALARPEKPKPSDVDTSAGAGAQAYRPFMRKGEDPKGKLQVAQTRQRQAGTAIRNRRQRLNKETTPKSTRKKKDPWAQLSGNWPEALTNLRIR